MTLLEWDDSLSLGDAMLDRQHKSLVALINQVHDAVGAPDGETAMMRSLTAMYLYAKEHFFDEEGLMARLGYPDLLRHKALHQTFVDKANELADSCLEGCADPNALLSFLMDWLTKHIAVEDARVVRFASSKGEARD